MWKSYDQVLNYYQIYKTDKVDKPTKTNTTTNSIQVENAAPRRRPEMASRQRPLQQPRDSREQGMQGLRRVCAAPGQQLLAADAHQDPAAAKHLVLGL